KRRDQREDLATSNRMPRFRIKAYSAVVLLEMERSAVGRRKDYVLLIPSRPRLSCLGHQVQSRFSSRRIPGNVFSGLVQHFQAWNRLCPALQECRLITQ